MAMRRAMGAALSRRALRRKDADPTVQARRRPRRRSAQRRGKSESGAAAGPPLPQPPALAGAPFFTCTATVAVAVLPAESAAVATMLAGPSGTPAVFHETVSGLCAPLARIAPPAEMESWVRVAL